MYDKNNIFAKIIRGEIPTNKVYEDEDILAINDINPQSPTHVLVMPKGEYISLNDFAKSDVAKVGKFFAKITEIAEKLGIDGSGYRIIANHGKDANQTVLHFHVHILGGKKFGDF